MKRGELDSLDNIGLKYLTDKSTIRHGYTQVYDKVLAPRRQDDLKLLEIGVYRGSSIRMWEEYFPNAEIHGIDNDPDCMNLASRRTKIYIGDQCDHVFLTKVAQKAGGLFDIIIDDGGHTMDQQITSFTVLWNFLSPGGLYAIEDLHTSYMRGFGGGYRKSGTTIEFLKDLIDDMNLQDDELNSLAENLQVSCNGIDSIQFYQKLCFISKTQP